MKPFYEYGDSETLRLDLICYRCTHSAWQKPHGAIGASVSPRLRQSLRRNPMLSALAILVFPIY